MGFLDNLLGTKKIEIVPVDRSEEAHEIKNDIQRILAESKNSMREHRIALNHQFEMLDSNLSDVSKRIAVATGGKKRIK